MAKKSRENPDKGVPVSKDWGFEYLFNNYLKVVGSWDSSKRKTTAIIALAVSALLLVVSTFLENILPNIVQALIAFPAAVSVFLVISAFVHFRRDEGEPSAKDKKSSAQRFRTGMFIGAVVLVLVFLVGRFIPYSVGGALLVTAVLFLYNYMRRTPEEIALAQAGLIDPRDLTEEELAELQEAEEVAEAEKELFSDEDSLDEDEFFISRGENT